MAGQHGRFRIGTSGYQYDHWVGVLYDDDLPKDQWLDRYCEVFDSVEINNTFYGLPDPQAVEHWHETTPDRFLFVLKYSRYGSHLKHLKDPQDHIPNFLEVARHLRDKLGPILVQLPPQWKAAPERLSDFLDAAPNDQRWAVEFRNTDWLNDEIFGILRQHNAALVVHDMIENHPDVATADWVYYRYHGVDYTGNFSHQALSASADRIARHLAEGRDLYAYFNNDVEGHAVHNARDLARYVEDRTT